MRQINSDVIEEIKKSYARTLGEDSFLPIINLCGSKVNIHQIDFFKIVKETLQSEDYFLFSFSTSFHLLKSSRYIESALRHNIHLEDIKQIERFYLESISNDLSRSSSMGIADMITHSKIPIVLYTRGMNDLEQKLHIDFFSLKDIYQQRNQTSWYDDAVSRCNKETVYQVIEQQRRIMEIILTLNPNSDIYTFSSYLPSKMNHSYEKPFRELLLMYNQSLLELCREYQLSYVNSRVLEQKSSQKDSLLLAHELLKEMSRNANTWKFNIDCFGYSILLDDTRLAGMMQDIYQDIMNYAYLAATKNGDEQALYLSLFKECGNDFFHFNRGFQKIKKRI